MSKPLKDYLSDSAFTKHLNEQVGLATNDEKPGHHFHRMNNLLAQESDAVLLQVYLGLAELFDSYPDLASVKPIWRPEVDPDDRNILVRFRMELRIGEEMSCEASEYGYDECPEGWTDTTAFDNAIEAGEYVGPEIWNNVVFSALINRKTPYASKADILAEMNDELHHFLPGVKAWALEQGMTEDEKPSSAKLKM